MTAHVQPTPSDDVLIDRARRGVEGAFDELFARHRARVHRVADRVSRNDSDAEEIVQETFLRAHRALGSFQSDARFTTWLCRIAINEALMRKRAARRWATESLDAIVAAHADAHPGCEASIAPWPTSDDLLEEKRNAEALRASLDRLDGEARAVLVMRELEERSADEVGRILGVQPQTVRKRAHRARARLRALVRSELAARAARSAADRADAARPA